MQNLTTILKEKLNGAGKITIMGVGSELRGDDAAGILVVRELEKNKIFQDSSKFQILYGHTAPENFTGEIRKFNPSHIIMIDSADMNIEPGSIFVIENDKITSTAFSTHSLPVKVMVNYMKESIAAESIVIGMQPKNLGFEKAVSEETLNAVKTLCGYMSEAVG